MSSLQTQVGAAVLPADDGYVTTNLRSVMDPAADYLIGLMRQALLSELDSAFQVLRPATALDGYVVNDSIPFDPRPWLGTQKALSFPVLAIWRGESQTVPWTLESNQRLTDWQIAYIVGEASLDAHKKLNGLLNGVENTVLSVLNCGFHPDYQDGYQVLTGPTFCNFWKVENARSAPNAEFLEDSDVLFPMVTMQFRTAENIVLSTAALDDRIPHTGVTVEADLEDAVTETEIQDFWEVQSEHYQDPV